MWINAIISFNINVIIKGEKSLDCKEKTLTLTQKDVVNGLKNLLSGYAVDTNSQ